MCVFRTHMSMCVLFVWVAATGALSLPVADVGVPCRGTTGRCGAIRAVQARVAAPPPPPGVERQKKRHALLFFGFCGTGFYGLQGQPPGQGNPEKPAVSDLIRTALLEAGFIQPTNWRATTTPHALPPTPRTVHLAPCT